MAASIENVRDFVLQIEKTLAAHRLYKPGSGPYREANDKLGEKCRTAAAGETLTVRIGAMDIFLDKIAVLTHAKREDAFFFPLYRDGLRELTFSPETTASDLESLLSVFEMKEQHIGSADDMVNYLWRCNLKSIAFAATDGMGEGIEEGGGADDLVALASDLAEKIKTPAPLLRPATSTAPHDGQLAASVRTTLTENPAVLRLTEEQTAELRREIAADDDQHAMERFIEILLVIARLPYKSIDPPSVAGILGQLADGYWGSREFDKMTALLTHMNAAAHDAPDPASRSALTAAVNRFTTDERLGAVMAEFASGSMPVPLATRLWDLAADKQIWPFLLDMYAKLLDGEPRAAVLAALHRRLGANMELLSAALSSPDSGRVRAALALLDERTEKTFAQQIANLANHPDESIRFKGLGTILRVGRPDALDILWRAMESDPSKSIRLYAFRAIQSAKIPGLAPRLQALVSSPQFAERPAWEREKYARLLGSAAGPSVQPLFESWIPEKRWVWQQKDVENVEVALRGLIATGETGIAKVKAIAAGTGKPADIARKVLESGTRGESA